MNFLSGIFRFIYFGYLDACSKLRVLRLKLLYPGISIDFKTRIDPGCTIICVKGARLTISNSGILFGTQIFADAGSSVSIDNSFIGRNCVIVAKESISISQGCLLAEMVVIRDQDHGIGSRDQFKTAPIHIGKNVWIASKATILKGVSIGDHAVVAASAVVNSHIPSHEVWGGIPAQCLKKIG